MGATGLLLLIVISFSAFTVTALLWLSADGYISVMNVELNIKDMLELGKKAQAAGRGANAEGDTISIGSRYCVAH